MSFEKILIIIPARKGSKGLKNKNKLLFSGIPLIEHTFILAKELHKHFNINTIVSSDDNEIKNIAKSYFSSNYLRSDNISKDSTSMNDTILDVIKWSKRKFDFDWILLMQPTSPQRTFEGILKFINHVIAQDKNNCFASISPLEIKKYELIERDENNNLSRIFARENSPLRQNSSDILYFEDGAAYMTSSKFVEENEIFINASKLKYFIAHDFPIIDIDNKNDFVIAEKLFLETNDR
tara:strand:- start:2186 stop:2896 length:711 start_codon:yes stop_codon:yes gene_type:complete